MIGPVIVATHRLLHRCRRELRFFGRVSSGGVQFRFRGVGERHFVEGFGRQVSQQFARNFELAGDPARSFTATAASGSILCGDGSEPDRVGLGLSAAVRGLRRRSAAPVCFSPGRRSRCRELRCRRPARGALSSLLLVPAAPAAASSASWTMLPPPEAVFSPFAPVLVSPPVPAVVLLSEPPPPLETSRMTTTITTAPRIAASATRVPVEESDRPDLPPPLPLFPAPSPGSDGGTCPAGGVALSSGGSLAIGRRRYGRLSAAAAGSSAGGAAAGARASVGGGSAARRCRSRLRPRARPAPPATLAAPPRRSAPSGRPCRRALLAAAPAGAASHSARRSAPPGGTA